MAEFKAECKECHASTLIEIVTIADKLVEETNTQSGALISKEDLMKVDKLHYIATVAENGLSKLHVDGKLCRQCPWYDK
jgi:hypothetical protein